MSPDSCHDPMSSIPTYPQRGPLFRACCQEYPHSRLAQGVRNLPSCEGGWPGFRDFKTSAQGKGDTREAPARFCDFAPQSLWPRLLVAEPLEIAHVALEFRI